MFSATRPILNELKIRYSFKEYRISFLFYKISVDRELADVVC